MVSSVTGQAHPNMTSKEPRLRSNSVIRLPKKREKIMHLNAKANLDGRIANRGRLIKATRKQAAAPSRQAPNPNNLSNS